jgi:DeoR/GlpR family transcriptional regulator of sugar metabolism
VTELFLEERRQKILSHLERAGRVSVAELSRRLGVSEVTIRSDLQALAEQQLVIRTHGGAIPAGNGRNEIALTLRRQQQVDQKRRIGAACAARIPNDSAVVLDSSSTALAIVPFLKDHHRLTIVTNSLVVAQEMIDAPGVDVVMPGGTLHPETASLIGTDGLKTLRKFNIQQGFFGAHGISLPEGLTDVSADEANIKHELLNLCRYKIAVVDTTKWGRVGMATFARVQEFDGIITHANAPDRLTEQVKKLGVEIIIV